MVVLFVVCLLNPFTFRVIVPDDFIVNSFAIPSNVYSMLTEYLGLRYNPEHRFIPINFLIELDTYFPVKFTMAPTVRERYQTARRTVSNYDGEKYFKGWIKWKSRNTTDENMYLTASLVGYETAQRFQKLNHWQLLILLNQFLWNHIDYLQMK